MYRKDSETQTSMRKLVKLTDEHLAPVKLKMKVSLATQIFSNACGSVMLDFIEENKLPQDFAGTAQLLFLMNDIFDSMNGSEKQEIESDTLKSAVKMNSIHFSFWNHALTVLPKMYFIDKTDGKVNNRSSVLKKLESTLRGYVEFSTSCLQLDVPQVSIRDTSQDGLENFFGCVKTCNQANKPTPREYRTNYATMVINNITGTNSLHSNCEQDQSVSILQHIHDFVVSCNKEPSAVASNVDEIIAFDPIENYSSDHENCDNDMEEMIVFEPRHNDNITLVESKVASHMANFDDLIVFDPQPENELESYFEIGSLSRISGSIYRKLIKPIHCQNCKNVLPMIETSFIENCTKVFRRLNCAIPHICFETSLKKKLITNVESIATDTMGCPDHDLEMTLKMKELCVYEAITSFCYDINRYLSGKINVLPMGHNHIQELAIIHKRKTKKIGKYSDIFNS
ncbi:uncharacterized protein LOC119076598 [Bradysia coprophila]|uniref:uncharacterized protein LOC119076598 n=2 Tax=Bradysia coprophila TaxID=38358 RepID=UPI00187DBC0E|nr:uncharacterized protein LOC119076598 [Bradysia coprophila]